MITLANISTVQPTMYWSEWKGFESLKYKVLDLILGFMCMEKISFESSPLRRLTIYEEISLLRVCVCVCV